MLKLLLLLEKNQLSLAIRSTAKNYKALSRLHSQRVSPAQPPQPCDKKQWWQETPQPQASNCLFRVLIRINDLYHKIYYNRKYCIHVVQIFGLRNYREIIQKGRTSWCYFQIIILLYYNNDKELRNLKDRRSGIYHH